MVKSTSLLQVIKKSIMTTSSKLEYDFINGDLQKSYVHVHFNECGFPRFRNLSHFN